MKMRKKTSVFLLFCSITIAAQEKPRDLEVKNSIFSVQAGFVGVWLNNEAKVVNNLVLRSEIGLSAGLWGGDYYDNIGFLMTPLLHLEPRYYYNINRRISKQKSINNNSGNFFSLKTTFHPNWFVISNYDNLKIISDFSVIPSYGFRRKISQHLNYEFSAGLGYRHLYLKDAGYTANKSELAPDLTLRLGYTF